MNVAAVVLPHDDPTTEITRIVYLPDEDRFLLQQGAEISNDLSSEVEAEVTLTLSQFAQMFDLLASEGFHDAIDMVRGEYTRKHFH